MDFLTHWHTLNVYAWYIYLHGNISGVYAKFRWVCILTSLPVTHCCGTSIHRVFITVITPFRNGRSPHEPTYHSIFNITTLLFQHGCSNILVYVYITPSQSLVAHPFNRSWHFPASLGTSGDSSGRFTRCRLLGGSPLPSSPSSGSSGSTWVRRWWYLAPGKIPGFFPMFFCSPTKTQKKKRR